MGIKYPKANKGGRVLRKPLKEPATTETEEVDGGKPAKKATSKKGS